MAEEGEKSVPVVILGESGEAHLLRVQGNDHFRAGSFQDAITCYSESLVIERNSGVYSNRAQAFLELDM
jgi:hypothetical protein